MCIFHFKIIAHIRFGLFSYFNSRALDIRKSVECISVCVNLKIVNDSIFSYASAQMHKFRPLASASPDARCRYGFLPQIDRMSYLA